jgi:hypothetical protein
MGEHQLSYHVLSALLLATSFRNNLWPSFSCSCSLVKFLRILVLQVGNNVGQAYLPIFLVQELYVLQIGRHVVRAYLCFLLVLSLVSPAETLSFFGKHVVRAYLCLLLVLFLGKPCVISISGLCPFFGKHDVLAYLCVLLVLFFVQPFRNDVL